MYNSERCFINNGKNTIIEDCSEARLPSSTNSDALSDHFENNEILLCETFFNNIDEKISQVDVGNKLCLVTVANNSDFKKGDRKGDGDGAGKKNL